MHIGIVGASGKPCMLDKIMTSYELASTAARMTVVVSFKRSYIIKLNSGLFITY
jgi:hypothetical protein